MPSAPNAPIKRLALIANTLKKGTESLAELLKSLCEDLGVDVELHTRYPRAPNCLENMDAACVLGGDGTLLSCMKEAIAHQVPVFGVNQGKLGFLSSYNGGEIREELPYLLQGHYRLIRRSTLLITTENGQNLEVINDLVIKSEVIELMELKVFCEEDYVTTYRADGLIFATPTGSTAYNLSAGGPIVSTGTHNLIMTPICPHTLSNRSIVFSEQSNLTVKLGEDARPQITLDGGRHPRALEAFPLKLRLRTQRCPLLLSQNYSPFAVLRDKLNWGTGEK